MNKPLKNLLLTGAAVVIPALINNAIFSRAAALGNALGGEGRFWTFDDGDVFYTKQGDGKPPIVLVHGIYAGATSYEWRKNFDALSEHFTVYAFDWLGFGLSDKPKIRYTAELYIRLLGTFIREVVGTPCAVVASSLGGAFAIEASANVGELVEHLILVCPTGMSALSEDSNSIKQEALYQVVASPIIGTSLYNAVASCASLRNYLQENVYFDPSYVTEEMVVHYSTASHQYGSQYAAQSFIGGQLNHSVRESLPAISPKTLLIIWGREARISPLSEAEAFLAANPRTELKVIDKAGPLPHDEQAATFNRIVVGALSGTVSTAIESDRPTRRKK